jgi:hypothetical protein
VSIATPHAGNTTEGNKGTILRLFDTTYVVTNIVLSNTNPSEGEDSQIDVAHLGQTTGELAARLQRPLVIPATDGGSGRQVTFDYIGKTLILDGSTGTVTITIGGIPLISAKPATVQSSTLTLATNDAIRGQAVVSIAR